MAKTKFNIAILFFIGASLVALLLSFLIIKPFLIIILTSIILSYLAYPVYSRLNKKIKRKSISAFIISILVLLLILGPMVLILNALIMEVRVSYIVVKQKIYSGNVFDIDCEENNSTLCKLSNSIKGFVVNPRIRYYIQSASEKFSGFVLDRISGLILSVPIIFLKFFIMVFLMFYMLKDGKDMIKKIENILPIKKSHRTKVVEKFKNVTFAVFYGHIFVALIQGTLGALGFYIFGIHSPILWGAVMAFFALIPFVGTAIIWFPVVVFEIVNGILIADNSLILKGVLFLLYGIFIISGIDNILKPKIIGDRAKIHPALVLIGVLGGLHLFGFVGIFLGPIILAIFVTFIHIYEEERILLKG